MSNHKPSPSSVAPRVHLAIYDQNMAGIASAALDDKAKRVIVLHRHEDNISGLQKVLQNRGITCDARPITGLEPKTFQLQLQAIFHDYRDWTLVFNASCGYRLLVAITQESFHARQWPVFVIDKYTDQWHWIFPPRTPSRHLSHQLNIREYLAVFNATVTSAGHRKGEPPPLRQLTSWLVENVETLSRPLASLNHLAMRAGPDHTQRLQPHHLEDQGLQGILERFSRAGLLRLANREIDFINKDNRFYANGGWLENHVFSVLFGLRKKHPFIQDTVRGLQLARADDQVHNELDVTVLAHNRLHIIECKTRRFSRRRGSGTPGASAVYRLGSLKSLLGGLSAKAMLISYQPLSRYTEQRAADLGIFYCAHRQLHRLDFHLSNFFRREKPSPRKKRRRLSSFSRNRK